VVPRPHPGPLERADGARFQVGVNDPSNVVVCCCCIAWRQVDAAHTIRLDTHNQATFQGVLALRRVLKAKGLHRTNKPRQKQLFALSSIFGFHPSVILVTPTASNLCCKALWEKVFIIPNAPPCP
jgi:hypothetical protein